MFAGMTPQWTFHTVSMPSAQGAENAKSIGVLYTYNFLARLTSLRLKKYKLIFEKRH
jgi:hypothetical protein